ncbi:MAG: NAD(+)/NADH kinase, partial [Clostridia bacterium]|nr:NAD(+)/NADH kinase [Clostridia bacterium]
DGTMLRAVREASENDLPVFGVNIGRMGFLTGVEYNDFEKALNSIVNGDYFLEVRMLLKALFSDGTEEIAVNDVCVVNETPGKLIDIDVFVNDSLAESFRGDGIIVSSPTGSTGYSMSAGGPIVSPMARCLIVTPICAHSLTTKPLVLCDTDKVKIEVKNEKNGLAVFDGQSKTDTDEVIIEKSTYTGKFIRLKDYNFFDVMSHKFSNKGFK